MRRHVLDRRASVNGDQRLEHDDESLGMRPTAATTRSRGAFLVAAVALVITTFAVVSSAPTKQFHRGYSATSSPSKPDSPAWEKYRRFYHQSEWWQRQREASSLRSLFQPTSPRCVAQRSTEECDPFGAVVENLSDRGSNCSNAMNRRGSSAIGLGIDSGFCECALSSARSFGDDARLSAKTSRGNDGLQTRGRGTVRLGLSKCGHEPVVCDDVCALPLEDQCFGFVVMHRCVASPFGPSRFLNNLFCWDTKRGTTEVGRPKSSLGLWNIFP